jgi:hypothetical protein
MDRCGRGRDVPIHDLESLSASAPSAGAFRATLAVIRDRHTDEINSGSQNDGGDGEFFLGQHGVRGECLSQAGRLCSLLCGAGETSLYFQGMV